jgi:integrase/recombinase XerD
MQYSFPVPVLEEEKTAILPKKKDNISEKVEAYLNTYDHKTVIAYKSDMATFFNFLKKPIPDVREADVLSYMEYLKKEGFAASTINRKIASLSKIMNIYKKLGLISSNPVRTLSENSRIYKAVDKRAKLNITLRDVEEVIRRARPRTGLIIKFLANTGLRISELLNITKSDLEPFDSKYMSAKINGKGNRIRTIYFSYDLYVEVSKVFDSESIYLFASKSEKQLSRMNMYKQISRAFLKYTGKKVHPHMLRHFFITQKIVKEGKDIKAISQYAGHSNIGITLSIYTTSILKPEDSQIL